SRLTETPPLRGTLDITSRIPVGRTLHEEFTHSQSTTMVTDIPSRRSATASWKSASLLLLAAVSLTSATPYPKDDLHDTGYSYLMPRHCDSYCGADNQFCCESGQVCTTLAGAIATCTAAGGGGGGGQYVPQGTTTWTETHTYTSTIMTFYPAAPEPTKGVDCVPQSDDQEQCGPICCAGWQKCAYKGQCVPKPGMDGGKTVVVTTGGKTTTQYSAPYRITGTTTVVTSGVRTTEASDATTTATSTGTADGAEGTNEPEGSGGTAHNKLSGGAIAGIVIGSLVGAALLALLLFFCLRLCRRRRSGHSQQGSIFNQPSPARKNTPSMYQQNTAAPQGYEVLPGGRIARMSALEGHSGDSESHHHGSSPAVSGYTGVNKKGSDINSSSDEYAESPPYESLGALRPPPVGTRRHGSLSSASVLGSDGGYVSPTSAGGFSSPAQVTSQQSEQLPFFKDYYSQDDIHPGDQVAVLWAYQPRAGDEFALERSDMIKVVGIWDDGWATGVMSNEKAEEWEARRQAQRDSGVSNSSQQPQDPVQDSVSGEMKAFPLVCVCLPQHWRKIIEGDGSTESGSVTAAATSVTATGPAAF
ncbi:hypothetical protein Golomagni_05946, partial [Golovinomyces magnicellulatus]